MITMRIDRNITGASIIVCLQAVKSIAELITKQPPAEAGGF
jgi:hypothetical protein